MVDNHIFKIVFDMAHLQDLYFSVFSTNLAQYYAKNKHSINSWWKIDQTQ